MKPGVWLRELRAPFFTGTLVPVAFGTAYAHWQGYRLDFGLLAVTLLGGLLTHAGLNMANDYFDHRHGGDELTVATPVSGGSKVIQEGLLRPGQVLLASLACLAAAAGVGLYLALRLLPGSAGVALLVTGVVGMAFAWFYTAPPLKLGHRRGMGELACTLGFGPVMVFGTYLVQSRQFSWPALAAGLPIGLLMGLVLFVNEFHDIRADRAVGKMTLVAALGTRASVVVLAAALAATYALTAALVVFRLLPVPALLAGVTVPLAWFAAARARRCHANTARLLPANFAVIGLHLLYGAVLTVAVAL